MMARKMMVLLGVALVIALGFALRSPHEQAPARRARPARVAREPARTPDRPPPRWARAAERRIAGRVLHDDRPVAGARVALSFLDGSPFAEATTDQEGHFALEGGGYRHVSLTASAPDLVAANTLIDLLDPTRDPERLELRLRDCDVRVTGTVRDRDGGPVVHATVRLSGEVGGQDAVDGQFALCARGGSQVDVRAEGYARAVVEVPRVPRVVLDISLVPEGGIDGVVRDEAGLPMADVHVWATSLGGPFAHQYYRALSDAEGRFALRGLPGSFYRLQALGDTGVLLGNRMLQVPPGEVAPADLKLSATTTVQGRLLDASGAAVPGVEVRICNVLHFACSGGGRSDAQGAFTATHVPFGLSRALVPRGWHVAVAERIDVPASGLTDVTVRVSRRGGITGTVRYAGSHVVGAEVTALSGRRVTKRVTTGADGSFFVGIDELTGVRLQARAGNLISELTWVHVPDASTEDVTVALDLVEAVSISGQVVDQNGAPISGATIAIEPMLEPLDLSTTTDDSGRFAFGPLVSGEYDVSVRDRTTGAAYAVLRPERARFAVQRGALTVIVDTSGARH